MRYSQRHHSGHFSSVVVGTIAAALVVVVVIGGSLRLADLLRPQPGDIIAFYPGERAIVDARAAVVAQPAGHSPPRACVLDPRVMLASGGSLAIEAAQSQPHVLYRVHWAGIRTSGADHDCGSSADLLLTPNDLAVLTLAAKAGG